MQRHLLRSGPRTSCASVSGRVRAASPPRLSDDSRLARAHWSSSVGRGSPVMSSCGIHESVLNTRRGRPDRTWPARRQASGVWPNTTMVAPPRPSRSIGPSSIARGAFRARRFARATLMAVRPGRCPARRRDEPERRPGHGFALVVGRWAGAVGRVASGSATGATRSPARAPSTLNRLELAVPIVNGPSAP